MGHLGKQCVAGLLSPGKVPGECFGIHFQLAIASFHLELGLAVQNSVLSLDRVQFQDLGHLGEQWVAGLLGPGKVPSLLGPDRFVDMALGLLGRAPVVAGECFGIHFQVAIVSFHLELGLAVRNSAPSPD